jgi:hypothetical protein
VTGDEGFGSGSDSGSAAEDDRHLPPRGPAPDRPLPEPPPGPLPEPPYGAEGHGPGGYGLRGYGPGPYGPEGYGPGAYGGSRYGTAPYGAGQYRGGQYGAGQYGAGQYGAGYGPPGMRASTVDRDRAIDVLKAAYGEGRLTKDEFDIRCARVMAARHYGDLAPILADLPGGGFSPYPQGYYPAMRPPLNGLAVGSLVTSIVGLLFPPATVAGVIMGHAARGQVRRTGQRGDGVAIGGLVVGYIGLAFWALIMVIAIIAAAHG